MIEHTQYGAVRGIDSEPVFDGLRHAGVTGRDIAGALRLSPATVSKWRRGHTRMLPETQVFLTLLLAEQVERLGDMYAEWGAATPAWHLSVRAGLDAAREALAAQENRNRVLPSRAVCDGARKFRIWWNADRIANQLAAKPPATALEAAATA